MKSSLVVLGVLFASIPIAFGQYQVALPGYRYEFPRDYFNHEEYRTEWWYTTGNVTAADGHAYGFELTFFREGVDRDPGKTEPWDLRDLYLAHLALSDLDGGRFYHAERVNRAGPGIAGADGTQQRIWNGNWEFRWKGPGEIQLQAVGSQFSLDFTLHSEKPPVIHGLNGVSQKAAGAGHASHYISLTRLSTAGKIELNGKTIPVNGFSWMDHEFFSNSLGADQIGWNWLSVQLEDNTELMLYQFRRKDGSSDPFSAGTFIDAQGKPLHLASSDFRMETTGETWTSPASFATYPVSWVVEVPKLDFNIRVTTRLKPQELTDANMRTPSYWEGAIRIAGARDGKPIKGVGYLEMTGYARPFEIAY